MLGNCLVLKQSLVLLVKMCDVIAKKAKAILGCMNKFNFQVMGNNYSILFYFSQILSQVRCLVWPPHFNKDSEQVQKEAKKEIREVQTRRIEEAS